MQIVKKHLDMWWGMKFDLIHIQSQVSQQQPILWGYFGELSFMLQQTILCLSLILGVDALIIFVQVD